MKTTTTQLSAVQTKVLLKAIDLELKAILENDIRKLHALTDVRIKQAAFLQLIAA
jgi:hypothetical protein